jgi:hypothetical protein
MANVGDSTHTPHGFGTITEVETVRGRKSFRVAGTGFNVWLDETKVHVADAAPENLFSYGPMLAERDKYLNAPVYSEGIAGGEPDPAQDHSFSPEEEQHARDLYHGPGEDDPELSHFAGLEVTIDPGGGAVNERNHTTLPYNYDPQYNVDMFRHEQNIQPGDYEIDPDERLHSSDSLSGNSKPDRAYPGPNPDLFAKHSGRHDDRWAPDDDGYDEFSHVSDPSKLLTGLGPPRMKRDDGPPDWSVVGPPHGRHEGSTYRPAGLDDRYAYFELEAADLDSPVAQFRHDPLGYLQICGYLWSDGDESLEKYADHTYLCDVDKSYRTAAWSDVREKAMRLRKEGKVTINDIGEGRIYATVQGDHGTYDTMIVKGGSMGGIGGGQSITNWNCSCDWGRWAFKRQMTYIGRLCSHAYAAYLDMQSQDITPAHFKNKQYNPMGKHGAILDDYKSWLKDNDQVPEAASVAAFLHTTDRDADTDEVDKLYDYISDNPEETPERKFDIPYTNDPEVAFKQADFPGKGKMEQWFLQGEPQKYRDHRDKVEELRRYDDESDDEHYRRVHHHFHGHPPREASNDWQDDLELGQLIDRHEEQYGHGQPWEAQPGPHHQADLLHTRPRSLTPNLHAVPEGEEERWTDVTKDDRETTGPEQIIKHFSSADTLRALHGGVSDDLSMGTGVGMPDPTGSGAGDPAGQQSAPPLPGTTTTASVHYADDDSIKDYVNTGELLDRLRAISEKPASDDLQHMDARNDKLRGLVEKLMDQGVDASFVVAARPDPDADGNFEGESQPYWADEGFSGSGPDPKEWYSDSAGYVDENERPHIQEDWADGDEGPITKYNDGRSKPQQGPRKGSVDQLAAFLHYADPNNGGMGSTVGQMGPTDPGIATQGQMGGAAGDMTGGMAGGAGQGDFADRNSMGGNALTAQRYGGEASPEDWENASGEPLMHSIEQTLSQQGPGGPVPDAGEAGEAAEGAGEGAELAEAAPLLLAKRGTISDDDIFGAAAQFEVTGNAPDGGALRGVQRRGRGPTAQIRYDPGPRQPDRPRQMQAAPPEDFGNNGMPDLASGSGGGTGASASTPYSDVLANFQRSAGAAAVMSENHGSNDDFASSPYVQSFLKTAGRKYSPEEQRELEAEFHPQGARNMPTDDDLQGTHYLMGL